MQLEDLDNQLATHCGLDTRNRILFSQIESTNAVGKKIASFYQRSGDHLTPTLLVALEQTAGRGRLGNQWLSPKGGIYTSLVRRIENRQSLRTLPMRVATGLCAELDPILKAPCRVKWPNDLMVEGKKVGGILIECVGDRDHLAAVVGFGVNYASDLAKLPSGATTLSREAEDLPSLAELTARLVGTVEAATLDEVNPVGIAEEYYRWSAHTLGQEIRCRTAAGSFSGNFLGFDDCGFLRLRTGSGEELISAGEIIEGESG